MPCLCGTRTTSLEATEDAAGPRGCRTADDRYYRTRPAVRPLWLSQDGGAPAPGGWSVSDGRVERVWRREGLEVPARQPKRGCLSLTGGSFIRPRLERPNYVWSYDFVEDRTHDGRKYRMLNVIDEFTHECLAIRVSRKLKGVDVIDVLSDMFILRGVPGHLRSDNVLRREQWHARCAPSWR